MVGFNVFIELYQDLYFFRQVRAAGSVEHSKEEYDRLVDNQHPAGFHRWDLISVSNPCH